ncbi:MAG: hypothetical protein EP340_01740 [Alphaproteobacteria bacterium]|nr:MAG: hypothetical protein EP340_01740 [Alphaproteobacteria bacterium]
MNWEAIGIIADIVAAGAIVMTLGFLARQIKGETVARRAQTRQELANARRNGIEMHLHHPDLRSARYKSRHGEELTAKERDIFFWYVALMLRDFENFVYQHNLGTLDAEELETARALVRIQLSGEPAFMEAAREITKGYAPTFSDAMARELRLIGLLNQEEPLPPA